MTGEGGGRWKAAGGKANFRNKEGYGRSHTVSVSELKNCPRVQDFGWLHIRQLIAGIWYSRLWSLAVI